MKAQDPQSTKTLTCPFDKDEPRGEFIITTALPVSSRNQFMDIFVEQAAVLQKGERNSIVETHKHYRELVRLGLKGTVNVYDSGGKGLIINGHPSDETLNHLAEVRLPGSGWDNVLNWLANEIWRANTLQDEEKKE
jgi:hypothetical protein